MTASFKTLAEIEQYLSGDRIQCLECGRWFRSLATHLTRKHGMYHNDYRDKYGIPRRYPLAGTSTRKILSEQMHGMIRDGVLTHDHLPSAVEAASEAGRGRKAPVDLDRQREFVRKTQPYNAHRLPPGAKRRSGQDADRAREYQRAYRALKSGDPEPMRKYREKHSKK